MPVHVIEAFKLTMFIVTEKSYRLVAYYTIKQYMTSYDFITAISKTFALSLVVLCMHINLREILRLVIQ